MATAEPDMTRHAPLLHPLALWCNTKALLRKDGFPLMAGMFWAGAAVALPCLQRRSSFHSPFAMLHWLG